MQRSLNTFSFSCAIRFKLHSNGYNVVDDLRNVLPTDLCKEIGVSRDESVYILNTVFPGKNKSSFNEHMDKKITGINLLDLAQEEKGRIPITTLSKKFDELLGGGIPTSKITEVCGVAGIGKTQLCLQLCVSVQVPKEFGGLSGEALFIDTEGGFTTERLVHIANGTIEHYKNVATYEKNGDKMKAAETFSLMSILNKIHFYRCNHYTEFIANVTLLSEFLTDHPQVKLIIIDSVAFPFKVQCEKKFNIKVGLLSELSQKLIQLAITNNLAVVMTNHMTTNVIGENQSYLIPAMGETWGHAATCRIILSWNKTERRATLNKCPWKEEATIPFQITEKEYVTFLIRHLQVQN